MSVDQTATAAQLTAAIAAVNASISTVGTLQNDSPVVLATVYAAVQSALVPFDNAIAAYDADIDTTTVAGVVAGIPVPQMISTLLVQAGDVAQQAILVVARSFVSRVGINVANAPG